MFSQLITTLTLALLCSGATIVVRDNQIKLPTSRRFNFKPGGATLLEIEQARARTLKSKTRVSPGQFKSTAKSASSSLPATNIATIYTVPVEVGNPPTTFNILIDTGSSNTWVGADPENPFVVTSTTTDTGEEVLVEYGSGLFFGEEMIDKVAFGGITIPQQSLGAAELALGFDGVDGILGIGPVDLTEGTLEDGGSIPTVTDNAFSLGLISSKEVGISFEPTTSDSVTNGELTFGGIDKSKFTGTLKTVPLTTTAPASDYVGIDQSVLYGTTTILAETAGIVDTGTTLILLASDAFAAYQSATGATEDEDTGLLTITSAQLKNLKSLFFNIGGTKFELTPNAQLWPRALNTAIGGVEDGIYLVVNNIGTPSGEGFDFINGFGFLERFYAVFDSGANTVSFATTKFTDATTN